MGLLLLATTQSDYATPWWPLWLALLLTAFGLILLGQPSLTRRVLGLSLLGVGLFFYGWAIYFSNSCFEGYADWTSCNVSVALVLLGIALFLGCALAALWRLLRQLKRR